MNDKKKSHATKLAVLALLAASAVQAAPRERPAPVPVPENLEVPAGNRLYLAAHAVGTQNQICLPRTNGVGLAWTLAGPQATLYNDDGDQSLTHFLSPNPDEGGIARATWQHSRDSSAVWALAVATSTDSDYVEAGAIPWLKLEVKGNAEGPDGGDRIAATTFIQRVNTVGGAAPAGDCPQIGARLFIPYEADYLFFRAD